MKTELTQEDHSLLEVLDRLARGGEAALDGTTEARECAEVLALLPRELALEAPRVEVWRAIQARVSADVEARENSASENSASENSARRAEAPADSGTLVQFPTRLKAGNSLLGEPLPNEPLRSSPIPVATHRSSRSAMFAMAAILATCLVGMGYFFASFQHQRSTIEALRSDLTEAEARHQELLQVQDQYSMVTRTARQYYPLRPVSQVSTSRSPRGRVWVCGMHQKWLLNVERITPAPAGYEYHFWFETEGGKQEAGLVEISDGVGRLGASTMPEGTTGFSMTLEPMLEGEGDGPQLLLHSNEAHDILLGIEESQGESMTM